VPQPTDKWTLTVFDSTYTCDYRGVNINGMHVIWSAMIGKIPLGALVFQIGSSDPKPAGIANGSGHLWVMPYTNVDSVGTEGTIRIKVIPVADDEDASPVVNPKQAPSAAPAEPAPGPAASPGGDADNGIVIEKAEYGIDHFYVDCTDYIRDITANGKKAAAINDEYMRATFGDPAVGVSKGVRVTYTVNGARKVVVFPYGGTIMLE
jgi:hypothetical protein